MVIFAKVASLVERGCLLQVFVVMFGNALKCKYTVEYPDKKKVGTSTDVHYLEVILYNMGCQLKIINV